MEDPANFAFLVLYMPMFPTPPTARESQARSVCSEVGAPFQCPVALAIPGPVGARVFGEDLQVGEQEGNEEGDRGLYFLCTRFRIMSDYYYPWPISRTGLVWKQIFTEPSQAMFDDVPIRMKV